MTPRSTGPGATPSEGRRGSAHGLRWRVVVDGALDGATNMARDHAAAVSLAPGAGLLRFYRWRTPTLSLGRNEPARGRYHEGHLAARGIDVVRRPTGGRAVLHHREVTYAVCLPLRAFGGLRRVYRAVNRGLVAGLRDLGVPAGLSGDDAPALPPDAGPCFRSPAPGEVVLRGRKLVGSAQARIGETLLQHGSLLIHDDQGLLAAARGGGGGGGRGLHPPDPPSGAIALAEVSDPPPPVDAIVPALIQGLSAALGGDWTDGADDPTFSPSVEEAWRQHYGDASWTWRR